METLSILSVKQASLLEAFGAELEEGNGVQRC